MISSYGDQSTPGSLSAIIIIVLHQRCYNCSECGHLMFYTCNYNIRVTHEMVLLSIFFTNRIHGGIIIWLFFIHFVARLALHLAVKILLRPSMKDLSTLLPHTSVGCISLQNASRTALVTQYFLNLAFYSNIWHKSSAKHKEVRPDWNDKNDNANYAFLVSHGRFNGSGCTILKKYSVKFTKDLDCELFYSELKRHNVSHYIYYLATDNIHAIVRKR